jgi:predicted DNA-binding transcriptional regulator AlpA
MLNIKRLVVRYLRDTADKIEAGNSELSESEAMDIMGIIAHESLSKEQACRHLNVSRSRFDDLIREKKLPKGRKVSGFKELRWYRDELEKAINKKQ